MDLNERWRERERLRARRRKEAKPEAKVEAKPEAKVESMPIYDFGALKRMLGPDYGLDLTFLHPQKKSKMQQVMDALSSVKISISDLCPTTNVGYFSDYDVSARSMVRPMPGTMVFGRRFTDDKIALAGNRAAVHSPEEAVRTARRFMIDLVTHEIDEWLYQAGLGPDPHKYNGGSVPESEVGKLSDRFT